MRACFVDGADLPITCSHDTGEPWNCSFADSGIAKEHCGYWQPERAVRLALDILGVPGERA